MLFTNRNHHQRQSRRATEEVPPAVAIVDDCSSSDDDDGNQKRVAAKKKQRSRRPCLEHVRLWMLTGRVSSSLLIRASLVAAVLGGAVAVWRQRFRLLPFAFSRHSGKPAMVGCFFHDVPSNSFSGRVHAITPPSNKQEWRSLLHHHGRRTRVEPLSWSFKEIENASEDEDHEKHRYPKPNPKPDLCKPQYDWQTKSFPVCNNLHEHTPASNRLYWEQHPQASKPLFEPTGRLRHRLSTTARTHKAQPHSQYRLVANGYWRDTWHLDLPSPEQHVALKTLRYDHNYTEYVLDKQRRDALASDRVQYSSQTIHMHAYCGTSALYEYAPAGDLAQFVDGFGEDGQEDWQTALDSGERLRLAYNVTAALADLHNTEKDHHHHRRYPGTAIVHGDFNAHQFVAVAPADGTSQKIPHFKLGDFNLARLVYWNKRDDHPCVVQTDGRGGEFRSPEEYARQHGQTEKVDIFSLGTLLYTVLTGRWPFEDFREQQQQQHRHERHKKNGKSLYHYKERIMEGKRPRVEPELQESTDPNIQVLIMAMDLCWKQDPHERSSAREIQQYLGRYLDYEDQHSHEHEREGKALQENSNERNENEEEEDQGELSISHSFKFSEDHY